MSWAENLMTSNSQPRARSPSSRDPDWNKVVEKGLVGAITCGLIALIVGALSLFKKKKG